MENPQSQAMFTFKRNVTPDGEGLLANLRREGTPRRAHLLELFLDEEVKAAICGQFGLADGLRRDDPFFTQKREIASQRFLGYDYVLAQLPVWWLARNPLKTKDTAELPREGGRAYMDEHRGPIMSWEDFEKYSWPDPAAASSAVLEWYEKNLPDDMCLISDSYAYVFEFLFALMGYEPLCFALAEQRDLVAAIAGKIREIVRGTMQRLGQFKRIRAVWGMDDMGFRTGTLISPADLREFVLPVHKMAAEMAHVNGWLYLLHSCGNLREIMPDLIDDVKIDAKHSFEDTIERVTDAKRAYGDRIALLGGIDIDFLCRGDERAIRRRVRQTLDVCLPSGGYCLGSGNSIANYVPLDNYLAMIDEARSYGG
jgi:uroporphyrinogen decarboxylase